MKSCLAWVCLCMYASTNFDNWYNTQSEKEKPSLLFPTEPIKAPLILECIASISPPWSSFYWQPALIIKSVALPWMWAMWIRNLGSVNTSVMTSAKLLNLTMSQFFSSVKCNKSASSIGLLCRLNINLCWAQRTLLVSAFRNTNWILENSANTSYYNQ